MTDERRPDDGVGDPAVDAAWRRAARDQPPARVDDAILAAARAEVRGHPQSRPAGNRQPWRIAWQPFAAAAGVVGLSFLLVQMLPRNEVPTPVTAPVPAADANRPMTAPAASGPAPPPAAASAEKSVSQPGVSQPGPAASDALGGQAPDRAPLAGAAPPAAAQAAAERSVAPTSSPAPVAWANRIVALHDAGDLAAAAAELRAFRAAYPDADGYLPVGLRAWAAAEHAADPP